MGQTEFASVEGFSSAYRINAEGLLRYFYRRTLCAEVAADLTAETFAKAWRVRKRYDSSSGSVAAWLQVLARQELLHYLRHERVSNRARTKLGIAEFTIQPDEIVDIERRCDADAASGRLYESIEALPASRADAIRLRVVDKLPYPEVAGRLGCTPGAARVRVARAIAELNQKLAANGVFND